jgi:uncharacterized membrane-anchored protein
VHSRYDGYPYPGTEGFALQSMNQRTHMQLRLQQTVEGLSVLAICYYLLGLLGYALKPLVPLIGNVDATFLSGSAAPIVVVLTWLVMRRVRHKVNLKQ